jgi:hypothetical protein
MDMGFSVWNVKSIRVYRIVVKELSKYKLDLFKVQEVRERIMNFTDYFVWKIIISAVKRVEFLGDRMPCVTTKRTNSLNTILKFR